MSEGSESSEKSPIRVTKSKRFAIWVELKRKGIPNRIIAQKLGISERLLDKNIREWKDDGTFDRYIWCEWFITYDALHERDDLRTVFQALTQMIMKRMKEQSEVEFSGKMEVKNADDINKLLKQYEPLFTRMEQKLSNQNSSDQQVDTAQTNT